MPPSEMSGSDRHGGIPRLWNDTHADVPILGVGREVESPAVPPGEGKVMIPPPADRRAQPEVSVDNHKPKGSLKGLLKRIITGGHDTPDIPDHPVETTAADQPHIPPVTRIIGDIKSATTMDERHPDWPAVELRLHLSAHDTVLDAKGLPELIKAADVVCSEDTGGDQLVPYLQDMANEGVGEGSRGQPPETYIGGIFANDKPAAGRFMGAFMQALYGSGVAIGHFDLRPERNDPVTADMVEAARRTDIIGAPTLEAALQEYQKILGHLDTIQSQRDAIMLGPILPSGSDGEVTAGRFEEEVGALLKEHPELRDKDSIVVVDVHGYGHGNLYHRGRAAGVKVTRTFSDKPFVFPYDREVRTTMAMGKQPSQELLARMYVANIATSLMAEQSHSAVQAFDVSTQAYIKYLRAQTSTWTVDEARQIFESERVSPDKTLDTINEILAQKGLEPLVFTNQDIEAYHTKREAAHAEKLARITAAMHARRDSPSDI